MSVGRPRNYGGTRGSPGDGSEGIVAGAAAAAAGNEAGTVDADSGDRVGAAAADAASAAMLAMRVCAHAASCCVASSPCDCERLPQAFLPTRKRRAAALRSHPKLRGPVINQLLFCSLCNPRHHLLHTKTR